MPEEVYLRMDGDGWVNVEQLGDVINHWCNCNTRWLASSLQPLIRELGMAERVQFDRHWCRADFEYATEVTSKSNAPVVLQFLRTQALADGVRFVDTRSHVWLVDAVPANLLQLWLPDSCKSDLEAVPFRQYFFNTGESGC